MLAVTHFGNELAEQFPYAILATKYYSKWSIKANLLVIAVKDGIERQLDGESRV